MVLPYQDFLDPAVKLELLQRLDSGGRWDSLDDVRCCTICHTLISGHEIRVGDRGRGAEPLHLQCPTSGCAATPEDWESPPVCRDRGTSEFNFFLQDDSTSAAR